MKLQIELDLVKELTDIFLYVTDGYLTTTVLESEQHLQKALVRLDLLINMMKENTH